ncbi:MAG TPA: hypothetical protein VFG14_09105 [Chthoniobacteraceae bacterium]|nr:hypothetical protein [Chthoniobacteraceae bacterium]
MRNCAFIAAIHRALCDNFVKSYLRYRDAKIRQLNSINAAA